MDLKPKKVNPPIMDLIDMIATLGSTSPQVENNDSNTPSEFKKSSLTGNKSLLQDWNGLVSDPKWNSDGPDIEEDEYNRYLTIIIEQGDNVVQKTINNQYGIINVLVVDDLNKANIRLIKAVKAINDVPSILNERLRNIVPDKLAKLKSNRTALKTVHYTSSLNGGSFAGEFEAIKNTYALEKQTMNMIGGANGWAPALAPEATSKATKLKKLLEKIISRLAYNGKTLDNKDEVALRGAIESLERHERRASTQIEQLKQYSVLVEKYKNTDDQVIKTAIDEMDIEDFVQKYMKTLKKADSKSSKLFGAFSA